MQTVSASGLELSRLGIGTVQWGLDYGVANVNGRPGPEQIDAMLTEAHTAGVNFLDTARAYGDSETVIGEALRRTQLADRFVICSKFKYAGGDPAEEAERSIRESLSCLKLESLPFYLLHHAENAFRPGVWPAMLRGRDRGYTKRLGVSISKDAIDLLRRTMKLEGMEAVQIPLNVFDVQLVTSGILDELAGRGVTVFVRSVFLQGVIGMAEEKVPEYLKDIIPFKRRFNDLAKSIGRDVWELACMFPLSLPGVSAVVIGCERPEQLRQNIRLTQCPPLTGEQIREILTLSADVPRFLIEPWQWSEYRK